MTGVQTCALPIFLGVWLALPLNDVVIILIAIILLISEYKHVTKLAQEINKVNIGEIP